VWEQWLQAMREVGSVGQREGGGLAATVNQAPPVFHLFSSENPDFIIHMAELRMDEFGMTFQLQCFKH
jgi:hypothetical protein